MRKLLLLLATVMAPSTALPADATPERSWEIYVSAAGRRSARALLSCYTPELRATFEEDGHRLQWHKEEIFALLARDYGYRIEASEQTDDRATLTVLFAERSAPENTFRRKVMLEKRGARWLISEPPQPQRNSWPWERSAGGVGVALFLAAGLGTVVILVALRRLHSST